MRGKERGGGQRLQRPHLDFGQVHRLFDNGGVVVQAPRLPVDGHEEGGCDTHMPDSRGQGGLCDTRPPLTCIWLVLQVLEDALAVAHAVGGLLLHLAGEGWV